MNGFFSCFYFYFRTAPMELIFIFFHSTYRTGLAYKVFSLGTNFTAFMFIWAEKLILWQWKFKYFLENKKGNPGDKMWGQKVPPRCRAVLGFPLNSLEAISVWRAQSTKRSATPGLSSRRVFYWKKPAFRLKDSPIKSLSQIFNNPRTIKIPRFLQETLRGDLCTGTSRSILKVSK